MLEKVEDMKAKADHVRSNPSATAAGLKALRRMISVYVAKSATNTTAVTAHTQLLRIAMQHVAQLQAARPGCFARRGDSAALLQQQAAAVREQEQAVQAVEAALQEARQTAEQQQSDSDALDSELQALNTEASVREGTLAQLEAAATDEESGGGESVAVTAAADALAAELEQLSSEMQARRSAVQQQQAAAAADSERAAELQAAAAEHESRTQQLAASVDAATAAAALCEGDCKKMTDKGDISMSKLQQANRELDELKAKLQAVEQGQPARDEVSSTLHQALYISA
jgi:chromosome segregation ATPase